MPPAIRIPREEDFASLAPHLHIVTHYPSPPESTTAILVLFHGLGDSEGPFSAFGRGVNLPGVLALAVRGTSPVPPAFLGEPLGAGPARHFHWGDDLQLDSRTGELDSDPGFAKAADLVLRRLVRETLVGRCGWRLADVLLFGFGQGGSLALGLASLARMPAQVEEVVDVGHDGGKEAADRAFKGVVSVGGPLPRSMVPTVSARPQSATPVLLCHGRASEVVDEDAVDLIRDEFKDVQVVQWRKPDDSMPANRDEMLPIMKFFADRLRSGW